MDKRGQLYLLAALLIGFIIFILVSPSNIIKQTIVQDQFEELSRNFDIESSKFLNLLIESNQDIENNFMNFTILFTSYSKTKNPDFGLIYSFIYNNKLHLANYLSDPIEARFSGTGRTYYLNGCFDDVKTTFSIAGLDIVIPDIDLLYFQHCHEPPQTITNPQPHILEITVIEQNNEIKFKTELQEGAPDLIIVSKEKKGQIRKIYTKGRFI